MVTQQQNNACAWCFPPKEGDEPTSHGICGNHARELQRQIEELRQRFALLNSDLEDLEEHFDDHQYAMTH